MPTDLPAPLARVATTTAPLDLNSVGDILVKSKFFSDTRDAAQAMVKVLAGRELGIPPMAAMMGVNVIQGKVALSATLLAAVIQRSGKYHYRVREMTNVGCKLEFFEGDESVGFSEFTHQDAMVAGLAFKQNYKQFPRNMLFARALSNGARWYCPGVFGGPVYVPEELGGEAHAVTVEGKWEAPNGPLRVTTIELDAGGVTDVDGAAKILDEKFPGWRTKPSLTRAIFGEPLMEPAALALFAQQEPERWAAAIEGLRG